MSPTLQENLNIKNDFVLYNDIKSVKALQAHKSLRSITERLSTPIETADKDTYLVGPYRLGANEKRANHNVESVSALVFDIDNPKGYAFEDIVALTSNYFGILHTTWSHTENSPRYRLVVHLKKEIPAREFSKIRDSFLFFNPELATIVDPACSDISRAYYWFSFPPERANNAQCCVLMGNPIDPTAYKNPNYLEAQKNRSTHQTTRLQEILAGTTTIGSRNKNLASLVGGLIAKGQTRNESLKSALQWNSQLVDPLPNDEVERTHNSIWKTHSRNNTQPNYDHHIIAKNKNFELIPASKLLASPPPKRDWVIEDFLPRKIVAAIIAAGGTGKSYLAMHIAISVASGNSLFDQFNVKNPKKVVFISGEDDTTELQRRLHKVAATLTGQSKTLLDKNLNFIDLADSFELFTERNKQGEISITENPSKICDSITSKIGDDIGLVIVDPISRFRGGEENLAADSTRFVQALQQIRDQLNTSVLCLHHVNKSAGAGGSQNNSRGSSAFIDGVRLVFQLNSMAEKDIKNLYGIQQNMPQTLTLQSVKSNYGKPIPPLILARRNDGTLEVFDLIPGDSQQKAILIQIQQDKLSKTQFKELFGGVKSKFGLAEKALAEKLEALNAAGLINIPKRNPMTITETGRKLINS
jgi:RecA-family ATPase